MTTALLADKRVIPTESARGATRRSCSSLSTTAAVLTALLADSRVDPNVTNEDGNTALIIAATETPQPRRCWPTVVWIPTRRTRWLDGAHVRRWQGTTPW